MADQQLLATTSEDQQPTSAYASVTWVSYKIDFQIRLRSLIARIVCLASADAFSPYLEFGHINKGKGFKDIDAYCASLHSLYTSPKTHTLDQGRWSVTSIRTYKETDNKYKDEYLIATARYRDKVVYVRIERRLRRSKVCEKLYDETQSSQPSNPHGSPMSPSDSAPLPDCDQSPIDRDLRKTGRVKKVASDEVSFWTRLSIGKATLVDAIGFKEGHYVPLPHLIILAQCINSFAAQYKVLTQNSFFFAQVTCEALKKLYPKHDLLPARGKRKRGTWNGLPANHLYQGRLNTFIDDVVAKFPEAWKTFEAEIDSTVNNPNSEFVKQERRKREEAERMEREERRKRKEAEQSAREKEEREKEERRRREEAERIAAEKDREAAEKEDKIRMLESMLAAAQAGKHLHLG